MKSKGQGLFKRAMMLVLGLFLLLPTVASAQWNRNDQRRDRRQERREERRERREERRESRRGRDWDGYRNYGGSYQLRQTALNAGYNEGIKEGRKDANRGRDSNYRNTSAYRKADKDYSSRLGDRELYRRYFRDGYENGYSDGYNGY